MRVYNITGVPHINYNSTNTFSIKKYFQNQQKFERNMPYSEAHAHN